MSEASKSLDTSTKQNLAGPDYFKYYASVVAELLSEDEDFLPFSFQTSELVGNGSRLVKGENVDKHNSTTKERTSLIGSDTLFFDAGVGLSDVKVERLTALLRQSMFTLTREVDEMLDPVINIRHLQALMRQSKSSSSYLGATSEDDPGKRQQKKPKLFSSSSSSNISTHEGPVSHSLTGEANDDLQTLLEFGVEVEERMKKHTDELSATLDHMEQQLEGLMDNVVSKLRPMKLAERHQLQRLIQKLHPKNLDRVVEILCRRKRSEKSHEEIPVELNHQDDATLWRLYIYTKAVASAGKLAWGSLT